MEEQLYTVGIVIADKDEYVHVMKELGTDAVACDICGLIGHTAVLHANGHDIRVRTVCSGIGKVNAAAGAMHLCDAGCTYILNFGLSGGISGVKRGETVLPDKFLEHDFDLTGIGYKPCEKPSQKYIYDASGTLLKKAQMALGVTAGGTAVCGDRFICSAADREFLRDTFSATTCDMETAAIASVCDMASVPYLSVRRVSDDAGDDAYSSYKDMNICDGQTLSEIFLKVLEVIKEV